MKKFFGRYAFFLLLGVFGIFSFSSCEQNLNFGQDVLPKNDINELLFTDTFSVEMYTEFDLPAITNNHTVALLGSVKEPVFGRTSCHFITQCLWNSSISGAYDDIIDIEEISLKIALNRVYNEDEEDYILDVYAYGYDIQYYNVYVLNDTLDPKANIYSNNEHEDFFGELLATKAYYPGIADSVLEIDLTDALKESFLNEIIENEGWVDNENFLNFFPGVVVEAQHQTGTGGSILRCDLFDELSGLEIKYRTEDTVKTVLFSSGTNAIKYNFFEHSYVDNCEVGGVINIQEDQQYAYVEGGGGLRIKIDIPQLDSIGGNIIINKAELELVVEKNLGILPMPDELVLVMCDSAGTEKALTEYNTTEGVLGEAYNSTSATYTFDLSNFVQRVMLGELDNYGLYLKMAYPAKTPERVAIRTGLHPEGSKLNIIYMTVEE